MPLTLAVRLTAGLMRPLVLFARSVVLQSSRIAYAPIAATISDREVIVTE